MSEETTGERLEAAVPPTDVEEKAQPEQQKEEQQVPLSALQSERALRQQKEQELQLIKENIELWKANMQQQAPKQEDEFGSMSENDVLTVGEAKKALNTLNKQYQLSIEELRVTQKYPDYQEVVTKFLPEVLKINPRLRSSLEATQDYELAYYLAKNSDAYKSTEKKKQVHTDAERIVQNSQKAGSLSSVGSASSIAQVKRYKEMSDEEFANIVGRNLGN